ncbi:transglycosylase SLT domain protein [mine drainage metagenome]|uniref:Transglycosylase SLT domain protein n=1 Tax=mine drainage metagenome TaxID=410659 RepID=A0A1J5PVF5_9ZZZZ
MRAIAIAETGRKQAGALRPWPWTVNMEGTGLWFDSEAEARTYAQTHLSAGADSFDVGCFQLNYRWHGQAFASLDAMFNPVENALYAARFLRSLYEEYGDWTTAAGAYHSRNPTYAGPYQERFQAIRAAFLSQDDGATPAPAGQEAPSAPRRDVSAVARVINAEYPLLQTGGVGDLGSLVPLNASAPRPFFAPHDPKG